MSQETFYHIDSVCLVEHLLSEVWIASTWPHRVTDYNIWMYLYKGLFPCVLCDFLSLERGQTFSMKGLVVETPGSAGQTVSLSAAW